MAKRVSKEDNEDWGLDCDIPEEKLSNQEPTNSNNIQNVMPQMQNRRTRNML